VKRPAEAEPSRELASDRVEGPAPAGPRMTKRLITQDSAMSVMPPERIYLSLIRPVSSLRDQVVANRIMAHILPFGCVAVSLTQLRIPEIFLPQNIRSCGHGFRHDAFPIPHPRHKGIRRITARSTKQVDMIRQYNIAANQPVPGLLPGMQDGLMHRRCCQQRDSVSGADCHEDNQGPIARCKHRLMDRTFADRARGRFGFVHCRRPSWSWALHQTFGKSKLCGVGRDSPHSKSICESSVGVTVIFFFGLACGAAGRVTLTSSDSSWVRMVFARSMTDKGRPASRATWMP